MSSQNLGLAGGTPIEILRISSLYNNQLVFIPYKRIWPISPFRHNTFILREINIFRPHPIHKYERALKLLPFFASPKRMLWRGFPPRDLDVLFHKVDQFGLRGRSVAGL